MNQSLPNVNNNGLCISYSSLNKPRNQKLIFMPKPTNIIPFQFYNLMYTPCISCHPSLPQSECHQQNSKTKSSKEPKRKVALSDNQQSFKDKYYQVFTSKKRFSKAYVKNIHDILIKELGLKPMSREEFRRIDLYFHHFSKYSNQILDFLEKNKEEINSQVFGNIF